MSCRADAGALGGDGGGARPTGRTAFSRVRFVRCAADERAATTLSLLAECFETVGGVPKVGLADRMA